MEIQRRKQGKTVLLIKNKIKINQVFLDINFFQFLPNSSFKNPRVLIIPSITLLSIPPCIAFPKPPVSWQNNLSNNCETKFSPPQRFHGRNLYWQFRSLQRLLKQTTPCPDQIKPECVCCSARHQNATCWLNNKIIGADLPLWDTIYPQPTDRRRSNTNGRTLPFPTPPQSPNWVQHVERRKRRRRKGTSPDLHWFNCRSVFQTSFITRGASFVYLV